MRFSSLVAVCLLSGFLFVPSTRAGEGPGPVQLGRQLKAMPWLDDVGDAPYEIVRYETIPVLANVPRRTAYYEIDPEVVASGYGYFFYVRGVDKDFVVGSVVKLAKLCRELQVVEELKKINKGKEFVEGVGDVFVGVGKGLGNLVMHPGLSFKNMGSAFRSMGRSFERAVGAEDKIGLDESGVNRSLLGDGPAGDVRRGLAYEMGVDVYTDNPVLKEILTELSQVRELGNLTSWAVPYGISMLEYFNPMAGDQEAELLIRDNNSYDLRRLVGEHLGRFYGLDREDRSNPLGKLLYNPNYTPREIAYISKDLLHMRDVGDHDLILRRLADARTPEEADLLTMEVRMYSFLHRRITPLATFIPFRYFFAAMGRDGVFRFVFVGDTVRPWRYTADAFGEMFREAKKMGARDMEIWTTADVDPAIVANAQSVGVEVRQTILLDRQFFPGPEQFQTRKQ